MKAVFFSIIVATAAAILGNAPSRAEAAVLPQAVIDAAIASANDVHRQPKSDSSADFPEYQIDGSGYRGFVNPDTVSYGYLSNGDDVLIVPLGSGGSGGVFYTLLFTSVLNKPYYIGYIPGTAGHLEVKLGEGAIVVTTPVYKTSDPQCCPSSHKYVRYTIADRKLKELTGPQLPAYDGPSVLPKATIDAAIAAAKDVKLVTPGSTTAFAHYRSTDGTFDGSVIPSDIDYGYLKSGDDLMIVPLDSGGSGGIFYTLLFTSVRSKPYYVGFVPSNGHLTVDIVDGQLYVYTPVYGKGDADCCPSGQHVVIYDLVDRKLKAIRAFDASQ